jgi:hypothetical protein
MGLRSGPPRIVDCRSRVLRLLLDFEHWARFGTRTRPLTFRMPDVLAPGQAVTTGSRRGIQNESFVASSRIMSPDVGTAKACTQT